MDALQDNKTCNYKGKYYYILRDIKSKKCFIEVDGQRKYLDCKENYTMNYS